MVSEKDGIICKLNSSMDELATHAHEVLAKQMMTNPDSIQALYDSHEESIKGDD